MNVPTQPPRATPERSLWREVAVPSEHGGWGLTLEPVLLGLLVAPSWPGVAIGLAALLAFLVRTPAKLVGVDVRRDRWLPRTRFALRLALGELVLLVALVTWATWSAGWQWWSPVLIALPFVVVEGWYDVRSRSRRLVPELCGAVGVAASGAAIVIAGDGGSSLAAGAWLILTARSVGAITFVRAQIDQARHGVVEVRGSDVAQVASVAVAAVAWLVDDRLWIGSVSLAIIAVVQMWWSRRPPPAITVIGVRQMVIGVMVVFASAAGVWIA